MEWLDLLWTLAIWGAVFGILWWAFTKFQAKIPDPFQTAIFVILIAAAAILAINILIGTVPLIPFGHVGSHRIG